MTLFLPLQETAHEAVNHIIQVLLCRQTNIFSVYLLFISLISAE